MQITPGRIVALLTPLVFAPAAGAISVAAAKYLPGVDVDAGKLEAIFIAGATVALGQGALWLKGWQDWEKRQDPAAVANDKALEEELPATPGPLAPGSAPDDELLLADGGEEDLGELAGDDLLGDEVVDEELLLAGDRD